MASESWKLQTWWNLPVYTGDVSGVCSALYELGGMVVMHDPSGCNSTYNTHDEIRWTSMESLIFLSGLTQLDAITGNDKKLIDDITAAAKEFHPAFIAIANSPVPWLIGTDFEAICRQVSAQTGISTFHVETNAMHDYTRGAGQAFLKLAKMLFPEDAACSRVKDTGNPERHRIRVNVLGMTPLDFAHRCDAENLRDMLEKAGFETVSVWAVGDTLDHLRRAAQADVNLVVSSVGIDAARYMEETLGIPYTSGIPVGAFSKILFEQMEKCARTRVSCAAYLEILERHRDVQEAVSIHNGSDSPGRTEETRADLNRCIAGEPVTMGSIAADLILRDRKDCDLIPLTETVKGLIPGDAVRPEGERQIRDVLGRYREVIADPMLRAACSQGCRFREQPHFALSGRMYLEHILPLITKE